MISKNIHTFVAQPPIKPYNDVYIGGLLTIN